MAFVNSLDGKPVIVVSSDETPISIGRFVVRNDTSGDRGNQLELCFETEVASCRLRIRSDKIPDIKATWSGNAFRYRLPAGSAFWTTRDKRRSSADEPNS